MNPRGERGGDPAGDRRTLGELVDRLSPAELAERMVHAFQGQIPGYQRLPSEVLAQQIVDVSKRNIELFFASVVSGEQPTDAELEPFRSSAKDRAAEGMPLEDLLAAYRLGGRLAWQAMSTAAEPGERDALLLAAELTMDYIDRVSAAVAQTYLEERQHRVSEEERRLRDLLEALVAGERLTAGLIDLADRMRFPLGGRYRAFSQRLSGSPTRAHSAAAAALRAQGVLALTEGDRVSGLAGADVAETALLGPGVVLALSEPLSGPDLQDALEDARLLVELGQHAGLSGPVAASDFLPDLLLARSPRLAEALDERVLGPLRAYEDRRGSDLVGTLSTFVECGLDRRASAGRLHIHPNTLDYRLRRIRELAALDLDRPDDLVLVTLALRGATRRGTRPSEI